tara:strand:- start:2537 stop:3028 length:492 start_codon:yes stop_codon:yes gene_type:complete
MFYTEPWKHHIVDNFFDDDTLKYCHNIIKSSSLKQNNHVVLKDKNLLSYFNKIYNKKFIENNFEHRPFKFIEPVGEINICTENFTYEIHEEASWKILSTVVYISPLHANGTILYNKNKKLSKIVTWKPNRAFTFCGIPNITWHSYGHWDKTTRITVNFFQKFW